MQKDVVKTPVTEVFQIQGSVDFLDVRVEVDNRLFIDPSRVRRQAQKNDKYAKQAYGQLVNFFDEVLRCLRSDKETDHLRGERLLQRFIEPNETRLGMSSGGARGHGAAEKLGSFIWSSLRTNPLCQASVAILHRVEDLPIFIKGIDVDITSDITTRIVAPALARFTSDMTKKHPEFELNGKIHPHPFITWDAKADRWASQTYELPVADDKPLLLVPNSWAGPHLLMNYGQYYQVPLLGRIQEERTVYVPGGKRPRRPTKESLKQIEAYAKSRETCSDQTARIAEEAGIDLLAAYRDNADTRAIPLAADKIAELLSKDLKSDSGD